MSSAGRNTKHVTRACVRCHALKRKCDTKAQGCDACSTNGVQCERQSAPDGRARPDPALREQVDALQQYITCLEDENAMLKAQVAVLQTERDAAYQTMNQFLSMGNVSAGIHNAPSNDCGMLGYDLVVPQDYAAYGSLDS